MIGSSVGLQLPVKPSTEEVGGVGSGLGSLWSGIAKKRTAAQLPVAEITEAVTSACLSSFQIQGWVHKMLNWGVILVFIKVRVCAAVIGVSNSLTSAGKLTFICITIPEMYFYFFTNICLFNTDLHLACCLTFSSCLASLVYCLQGFNKMKASSFGIEAKDGS